MNPTASNSVDFQARRDLAVARMNRGHALAQGEGAEELSAALQAYDQAVALLGELPHERNPDWRNSLAAALMNRGSLLHRRHGIARAVEALTSFDEAEGWLRTLRLEDNPWYRRNLAGTLLNRCCLLLDLGRSTESREAANEALGLARPTERTEIVDAEVALKSRRALCDAIGQLLAAAGADQNALASEASDLVDDALALVRFWVQRGAAPFRPAALRLFRFGAQLYRLHQPQFLAEFLLEQIESAGFTDPEFRAIALENLDAALRMEPGASWLTVGDVASERQLRLWRELEAARAKLTSAA